MFPPHHGWKLACDRADWIAIGLDINRRKGIHVYGLDIRNGMEETLQK